MVKPGISGLKVAILHQGAAAPAVGGVKKPFKPGGLSAPDSYLLSRLTLRV